jgi:hypothetical protein
MTDNSHRYLRKII